MAIVCASVGSMTVLEAQMHFDLLVSTKLLTEFSRLVRSEQYAALLLPQLANAVSAPAATIARGVRTQAPPVSSRGLSRPMPFNSLQNTVERCLRNPGR
jgi:hypothetical protein